MTGQDPGGALSHSQVATPRNFREIARYNNGYLPEVATLVYLKKILREGSLLFMPKCENGGGTAEVFLQNFTVFTTCTVLRAKREMDSIVEMAQKTNSEMKVQIQYRDVRV